MKLRSVAMPAMVRGERDRSAVAGEGGGMPLDSGEVSRNESEHRKGLVTLLAVTNPPDLVKSGIIEEATGVCTQWTARGNR